MVHAKLVDPVAIGPSLLEVHETSRQQRSRSQRTQQKRTRTKVFDGHGSQSYQLGEAG
jgi:hypothetical protein